MKHDHNTPVEGKIDVYHQQVTWTWWLWARWSVLLGILALALAIVGGVGFFLFSMLVVLLVNVPLGGFAFLVPFLVFPIVWTLGMVLCYRRHPSGSLMVALGMSGAALYLAMPVILFMATIMAVGGWNVR